MGYAPTNWVNKVTTLGPTNLNHLEQGLDVAADVADAAQAAAAAAQADATSALSNAATADTKATNAQTAASAAQTAAANAQTTANAAIPAAQKGVANGVATLDSGVLIPVAQIPQLVGIGTTLPASPTDQQEFILVDSLTAPTYQWRMRYLAGISDANKWICVGGSEAYAAADASVVMNTGSFTSIAGGPTFTVPRAGLYTVQVSVLLDGSGSSSGGIVGLKIGAAAAIPVAYITSGAAAFNPRVNLVSKGRYTCAASDVLELQYQAIAGSANAWLNRRLLILPHRVA
jgi:hypothetical protein